MQETPITPTPTTPLPSAPAVPDPQPKRKKTWLWVAIGAFVLVAIVVIIIIIANSNKVGVKDLFYTMVETASQKTKVHYAQDRDTPKSADATGIKVRSLAEYDFATKEYSMVSASEAITSSAYRCVKGKEYRSPVTFPDNLAEAVAALDGDWKENTTKFASGSCKYQSVRYQGPFTDGLLPVGLNAKQAKNMAQALKLKDAVIITDEGQATYKDKTGRKVGFEVSEQKSGKPFKADAFFYAFRDGTSNTVGANDIKIPEISNHYSSLISAISPSPGVKGFYIIDEKTNLPIYSEITTTADGTEDFTPTTFVSEYGFPEQLTIDVKTPLVEIAKPK